MRRWSPEVRPAELPLSHAQRRLWFLERLEGPSATYTIPFAVRLRGELDAAALQGALSDLMARHESLRTVYPERAGVPRQEVLAQATAVVRGVEVDEGALAGALSAASGRGFDLASEPPLRAHLFGLGGGEHVLLLLLHHIAGDGWSLAPLWRDVARFYAARRAGVACASCRRLRCSTPTTRCGSVRCWATRATRPARCRASFRTGRSGLRGCPSSSTLPSDRARPAVASHRGGSDRGGAAGGAARRGFWGWRGRARPACSWCCRPVLRRC